MTICLRFVAGTSLVSKAIIAQEKTAMPLTPSHVEAKIETKDGIGYIGSHLNGGVQWRPIDYDKGQFSSELILDIVASDSQTKIFNDYIISKIGTKYDWEAIFGFIIPEHFHMKDHEICSALCTLGLRKSNWLQWPVAAPAHLVSPRDLLLMASAIMQVPGI